MSWSTRSVAEFHVCPLLCSFLPHYSEPFIVVASEVWLSKCVSMLNSCAREECVRISVALRMFRHQGWNQNSNFPEYMWTQNHYFYFFFHVIISCNVNHFHCGHFSFLVSKIILKDLFNWPSMKQVLNGKKWVNKKHYLNVSRSVVTCFVTLNNKETNLSGHSSCP